MSYADVFYSMPNGKYAGTIKGFPGTAKFSWCKKLKTDKVDLRGYILSSNFNRPQERERERSGETSRRTAVPESTDSRKYWELGVSQNSNDQQHRIPESELPLVYGRTQKGRFYGFPISPSGNWCTQLKTAPCEAPERGAENKYRSLLRHCGR